MSVPQIKKQLVVPAAGAILFGLARLLLYFIRSALVTRFGYDPPRYGSLSLLETLMLIVVFGCVTIITVRLLTIALFDLVLQRFYQPTSIDRTLFSFAAYAASIILIALTVSRLYPEIYLGGLFTTSFVFLLFILVGIPLYIFVVNKSKDLVASTSRARFTRLLIAPLILTPILVVISHVLDTRAAYFAAGNPWVYGLTAVTGIALSACMSFLLVRTLNEIVFFDYRIRKGHQASVLDRNVFSAIAYVSSWPLITSIVFPSVYLGASFFTTALIALICFAIYVFWRFSGYGLDQDPPSDNKWPVRSLIGLSVLIVALATFYFISPGPKFYGADSRKVELLLSTIPAMLWMGVAVCVMQLAPAPIFKFSFRVFNGHEPGPISQDIFSVIAHLFAFAGICLIFVPSLLTTVLITTVLTGGLWKTRKRLAEWFDRSNAHEAVDPSLGQSGVKPENALNHEVESPVNEGFDRALSLDNQDSSARLRHAIENIFPHLIARSFYQLRGLDDWLAEIPQIANVLGLTLEHLAIIALSEYFSGEARDVELNRRLLETLQKPVSHGAWAGILREILVFLRHQPQQMFSQELIALYFPAQGENSATTLKELGDELVQLRNDLIKRTAGGRPSRDKQQRFKKQLVIFLQSVAFLKDYPLVSVRSTKTQAGIKSHSCYLHVGFHDPFEQVSVQCDLDLESTWVTMLNPQKSELLYLYPFYTARECPECGALHLFHFNKLDKGRVEYTANEGHSFRDATAGADLIALLEKPGIPLRQTAKYLCLEATEEWHRLSVGQQIDGKFEIVKHLRRGGMADVYEVRDLKKQTRLALKLLPFQFLSDRTMLQRFRQEATRARSLDHPNITRVFDYGEDLVDHYIVMELAEGWRTAEGKVALDLGELPKPLAERTVIAIIKQACEGLDYIHRQEIIHRDIKPGNLLLFDDERVKLADFGIARSHESITLTMTGLAMGTPEYMSPEQAEGKKELSFASDIYSLGVVMYELIAGQPPFKRSTPLATAVAHLRDSVPPLSQFHAVSNGLQLIVMKCLEKEPKNRFDSVSSLYQEIDRYERGEAPTQSASVGPAVRYVEKTLSGHEGSVNTLVFAPDGSVLASGGKDRTIRFWDVQTATLRQTLSGQDGEVTSLAFSPDGQLLMSGSIDKTTKLWDAHTLEPKRTLTWLRNPTVDAVAFSPDGRCGASGGEIRERIAGASDELSRSGEILLWDTQTLTLMATLTGHEFTVTSLAFSPDSAMLASGSWDKTIRLWNVSTGELKITLSGHEGAVHAVAFAPNGKTLASVSEDQTVKLWDPQTGEIIQTLAGHSSRALALAFSPDGTIIASGGGEHQKWGEVKLWNARTGELNQTLRGHDGAVLTVAFSPSGETLASGGSDGTIGLWDLRPAVKRPLTKFVLWVCDNPEDSAAAIAELRQARGMTIMVESSTGAMATLMSGDQAQKIAFVVSDAGHTGKREHRAEVDLRFIEAVRQAGIDVPIYVFCDELDVETNDDEVLAVGGNGYIRFNSMLGEIRLSVGEPRQGGSP